MSIANISNPTFLHANQIDAFYTVYSSTQIKGFFDSQATGIISDVNTKVVSFLNTTFDPLTPTVSGQAIAAYNGTNPVFVSHLSDKVHYINVQKLPSPYHSAIGDGVADDTQAFNDAITYAVLVGNKKIFVPIGTYMINAVLSQVLQDDMGNINVPSGFEIWLDINATLKVITNSAFGYAVFSLKNVSDIYIHGGKIIGDRTTHNFNPVPNTNPTHEWGHGIYARNVKNIIIRDMNISKCTGDGIYIGGIYPTTSVLTNNILIDNVYVDNVRRNGITIGHGTNIKIKNCSLFNVDGTAPKAGIDIEGEAAPLGDINGVVTYVSISDCYFDSNTGTGIQMLNCSNIIVLECKFANNSPYTIIQYAKVSKVIISDNLFDNNVDSQGIQLTGSFINVLNNIFKNSGILVGLNSGDTILTDVLISKNNFTNGSITFTTTVICENVSINDNNFNDNNASPISAGYSGAVNNLSITNNKLLRTGPVLIGGQNIAIENNKIISSILDGLYLYTGCNKTIIKGNSIKNWGLNSDAINITGKSDSMSIVDNVLELTSDIGHAVNIGIALTGDDGFISNNRIITGTVKCTYALTINGLNAIALNNDFRNSFSVSAFSGNSQKTPQNYISNDTLTTSIPLGAINLIDNAGITTGDIPILGASIGDFVIVSAPYDLQGLSCNGYVSASGIVKVRLFNKTGVTVNLADNFWNVRVLKY